jgi:hypothetical protein
MVSATDGAVAVSAADIDDGDGGPADETEDDLPHRR